MRGQVTMPCVDNVGQSHSIGYNSAMLFTQKRPETSSMRRLIIAPLAILCILMVTHLALAQSDDAPNSFQLTATQFVREATQASAAQTATAEAVEPAETDATATPSATRRTQGRVTATPNDFQLTATLFVTQATATTIAQQTLTAEALTADAADAEPTATQTEAASPTPIPTETEEAEPEPTATATEAQVSPSPIISATAMPSETPTQAPVTRPAPPASDSDDAAAAADEPGGSITDQMMDFVEENPSMTAIIAVVGLIFLLGIFAFVRAGSIRRRMK